MAMTSVFLDRDGTINREVDHLRRVDELELYYGAAEAIRRLNRAGLKVIIVTNQAGVARGLFSEEQLAEIHHVLQGMLAREGAFVDAIYYCPHHPTEGLGKYLQACDCRKPNPGSLFQAARDLDIDLKTSFFVGDKRSDLEAGQAAGCRTVLVRTGYGLLTESSKEDQRARPDHIATNLLEAAEWILAQRN